MERVKRHTFCNTVEYIHIFLSFFLSVSLHCVDAILLRPTLFSSFRNSNYNRFPTRNQTHCYRFGDYFFLHLFPWSLNASKFVINLYFIRRTNFHTWCSFRILHFFSQHFYEIYFMQILLYAMLWQLELQRRFRSVSKYAWSLNFASLVGISFFSLLRSLSHFIDELAIYLYVKQWRMETRAARKSHTEHDSSSRYRIGKI